MSPIARISIALLFLSSTACTRSFQVYDVTKLKETKRDYLFYALPRTVVKVVVPVTKIEKSDEAECGSFDDLRAELLLPKPEKKTVFKIGAPVISSRAEADPDSVFGVDLKFKPLAVTAGVFEMNDSGALTNATVSHEDQSLDTVLTVAKAVLGTTTGVAASVGPGTSKETGCKAVKTQIEAIRTQRITVVGEAIRREGANKEFLETVLGKLEEMETALAALFTGETTKTLATARCEIRPTEFAKANAAGTPLFIFEADAGVSSPDDRCVIPASVRATLRGTKPKTVSAKISADGAQFSDAVSKARRDIDDKARGFFYRVPATAVVAVDYSGDVRGRELMQIAQLGTVATLPVVGGAFVRKASVAPTLNAAGGLQKLTINGESSVDDAVAGAAAIYTGRRTAEAQAAAAAAASKDELALLERERKLVEERLKIAEAQKKLAAIEAEGQQ